VSAAVCAARARLADPPAFVQGRPSAPSVLQFRHVLLGMAASL